MSTTSKSEAAVREKFEEHMEDAAPEANLTRPYDGRYLYIAVGDRWESFQAGFYTQTPSVGALESACGRSYLHEGGTAVCGRTALPEPSPVGVEAACRRAAEWMHDNKTASPVQPDPRKAWRTVLTDKATAHAMKEVK